MPDNKPLSKNEIVKKNLGVSYEYHDVRDWENLIQDAMYEYAKQEAIEFANFCFKDFVEKNHLGADVGIAGIKAGDQLYTLYLQSK